jgi:enoyl-CoA hydratase/carnithine racemase
MYEHVKYEVEDAIATVTLNRPDKLNAYIPAMGDEVVDAFATARDDETVRVVILTGAGRAFCAGVDLDFLKAQMAAPNPSGLRLGEEAFVRQWPLDVLEYPKPVIAAINGAAVGVGVTMTLPCDVRLAAEDAKLGLTFAKLGMLPGLGSTHLLPSLVGLSRALDLVLAARTVTAQDAATMGLVQDVVAAADLQAAARAKAAAMAQCRPEVLAAAKRALRFGAASSMEEAMRNEREQSGAIRRR